MEYRIRWEIKNFYDMGTLRPGKAVADKMMGKPLSKIIFKLCFSENNNY